MTTFINPVALAQQKALDVLYATITKPACTALVPVPTPVEAPTPKAQSSKAKHRWERGTIESRKAQQLSPSDGATISGTAVITLLVAANPKHFRGGIPTDSRLRFALYTTGMTVDQYKAAVKNARLDKQVQGVDVASADLAWDLNHGYISIA
jgi:hypothetical protein